MMKKMLAVLVAVAIAVGAMVPALAWTDTASACENGLTPGYWKNHTEVWDGSDPEWDGPTPDLYFDEVFGIVGCQVGGYVAPHRTLLQVLRQGGGKFDALNRHAVAALLNSYWLDSELNSMEYWSAWWIKTQIQDVYNPDPANLPWDPYDGADWESCKDAIEATYSWAT
jgi:hypothetical protein